LINETVDNGWSNVTDEKNIKIHKKHIKGMPQLLVKSNAILDGFSKEEVFEAISNVNIRKEWDKIFSEFKIVETNDKEGWEVLYMSIKSPSMMIMPRDFVQKRKIWRDFPADDSIILHFKSVDHPQCPDKKGFIRASTIISGYFIKQISTNPLKTILSSVTQTDIKGSIPQWLVNSVSQKAPKEWVNNLIKGCEKIKANKK
jgi:hypothetical protein